MCICTYIHIYNDRPNIYNDWVYLIYIMRYIYISYLIYIIYIYERKILLLKSYLRVSIFCWLLFVVLSYFENFK